VIELDAQRAAHLPSPFRWLTSVMPYMVGATRVIPSIREHRAGVFSPSGAHSHLPNGGAFCQPTGPSRWSEFIRGVGGLTLSVCRLRRASDLVFLATPVVFASGGQLRVPPSSPPGRLRALTSTLDLVWPRRPKVPPLVSRRPIVCRHFNDGKCVSERLCHGQLILRPVACSIGHSQDQLRP
jgi:hypothetical protein